MNHLSEKIVPYGGQAVIEGVMFAGKHTEVTAIRRKDGSIETFETAKKTYAVLEILKKVPILRGLIALIESTSTGAKHIEFASEKFELDEGDAEAKEEKASESSDWMMWLGIAAIAVITFFVGKGIFTAVPAILASVLFDRYIDNLIVQNIIEGILKTILLLTYLAVIAKTPMVKRVFQYHGAEHKVINTYENRESLTVENVQKQSRLHYRCGSSFLIFTIIVGVIFYSFFPYENVWDRVWTRIIYLPFVIGLSYEALQFTNLLREIPILRYLGYPGLWLQKLTTNEPDADQIEVAITAFTRMRELDATYVAQERNQTAFVS